MLRRRGGSYFKALQVVNIKAKRHGLINISSRQHRFIPVSAASLFIARKQAPEIKEEASVGAGNTKALTDVGLSAPTGRVVDVYLWN